MKSDRLSEHIRGLGLTETQLKMLLEILVHESMEYFDHRLGKFWSGGIGSGSTLAGFENEFGVSSYRLEIAGYRRTFSRSKDYLLDNCIIKTLPVNWPDDYKRRGTYYNTTPLGKVLAMKYWYKEFLGKRPLIMKTNEHVFPPDIWSNISTTKRKTYQKDVQEGHHILDDGRLGIEIKLDDLLVSFFQFLPRLKKYIDDIKKPFSGLGPKDALLFTFSEIDINSTFPRNRATIEVKFRSKYETHVQIIKYFRLDDPENVEEMYDYILDSLTYLFLTNLEVMQKELDVKNPVIAKILEDPDLKSFREDYQMKARSDLQESLNLLSDDD